MTDPIVGINIGGEKFIQVRKSLMTQGVAQNTELAKKFNGGPDVGAEFAGVTTQTKPLYFFDDPPEVVMPLICFLRAHRNIQDNKMLLEPPHVAYECRLAFARMMIDLKFEPEALSLAGVSEDYLTKFNYMPKEQKDAKKAGKRTAEKAAAQEAKSVAEAEEEEVAQQQAPTKKPTKVKKRATDQRECEMYWIGEKGHWIGAEYCQCQDCKHPMRHVGEVCKVCFGGKCACELCNAVRAFKDRDGAFEPCETVELHKGKEGRDLRHDVSPQKSCESCKNRRDWLNKLNDRLNSQA